MPNLSIRTIGKGNSITLISHTQEKYIHFLGHSSNKHRKLWCLDINCSTLWRGVMPKILYTDCKGVVSHKQDKIYDQGVTRTCGRSLSTTILVPSLSVIVGPFVFCLLPYLFLHLFIFLLVIAFIICLHNTNRQYLKTRQEFKKSLLTPLQQ